MHEPSHYRPIAADLHFNQPSPLTHAPLSTHAPLHFIFLSSSTPHRPNSLAPCRWPTLTHLTLATDPSPKSQVPSLPTLTHLGLSSLFLTFVLVFQFGFVFQAWVPTSFLCFRHGISASRIVFWVGFLLVVINLWVSASRFVFMICGFLLSFFFCSSSLVFL